VASLRDGRRCVAVELGDLRLDPGTDQCEYRITLLRADGGDELDTVLSVDGNREPVSELRSLCDQLGGLASGDLRAMHFETLEEGFVLQVEQEGDGLLRVEIWMDLVRLDSATRLLAFKGEPQFGLRLLAGPADIGRFWTELQDDLARLYS